MQDRYREAIRNFFEKSDKTINALNEVLAHDRWDRAQCAGAGKFLSNIYLTVENVLQAVLRSKDIKIVKDEAWHKILLQKSKELGLFPKEIHSSLFSMLQFRHIERTGYGIDISEEKIRENAPDAIETYASFKAHVLNLIEREIFWTGGGIECAQKSLRHAENLYYDSDSNPHTKTLLGFVCAYSQLSAAASLEAFLALMSETPPQTSDIVLLRNQCSEFCDFSEIAKKCDELNSYVPFSIEFLDSDAVKVLDAAKSVLEFVLAIGRNIGIEKLKCIDGNSPMFCCPTKT